MKSIGQPKIRKEGLSKVTGQAKYIDDITMPGMLHGVTVRSKVPRGKIKSIQFLEGVNWAEYVVVNAKDIPGKNVVTLIEHDQPLLAETDINHFDEPILLLAHPDKGLAEKARNFIEITYEELTPIFSMEESLNKTQVIWGKDNIFKEYKIRKGDPSTVWGERR
jgi:CO/xanthine dehydrogenase Mo-binding subunit